jgi:MFS family permease
MAVFIDSAGKGEHHELAKPAPGAWRLAWLVMAVATISWLDRTLIGILIEPMKAELNFLDTEISLLTGLAFSICYGVGALPIAWLADRMNRALLLAAGVTVWCSLTIGFGFASAFWVLFLCRMGVGLGEATAVPCSVSLLSDRFPRTILPRGLAIFQLGSPLGLTLATAGGAALATWFTTSGVADQVGLSGWRLTFVVAGAMGLVLVVPLLLTRDKRTPAPKKIAGQEAREGLIPHLKRVRRYIIPLMAGNACFVLFLNGYPIWLVSFFQRVHGWSLEQTGLAAGGSLVATGILGALAAGYVTPRLSRRFGRDATMRVKIMSALVIAPLAVIGPVIPNAWLSLAVMCVPLFFTFGVSTLMPGAIVNAAPSWLRARFVAINVFLGSLIGGGLGALFYASLTDYVFQDPKMIHWSLALGTAIIFAAIIPLWMLAGRRYHDAIHRADEVEKAAGLPSHDDGLESDEPVRVAG